MLVVMQGKYYEVELNKIISHIQVLRMSTSSISVDTSTSVYWYSFCHPLLLTHIRATHSKCETCALTPCI